MRVVAHHLEIKNDGYKGKNRDTAWCSILDDEWPEVSLIIESWLSDANVIDDKMMKSSPSERMCSCTEHLWCRAKVGELTKR